MQRRPQTAAALAVALFVVGQLLALGHEAETTHVTCNQHGELLEAPDLTIGEDDGCGQAHFDAVDGDAAAHHQDCAIARLLRTSTRTSHAPVIAVAATDISNVGPLAPIVDARAIDVIVIAPKTSPPV